MSWPLPMLVTIIATSIGTRIAPEFVTLLPITHWHDPGRKKIAPNMDIATAAPAMLEKVKMLLFHRRKGSTGSAARVSTHTKAARRIAAAEYRPMICHEFHGYWPPPQTVASRAHVIPVASVMLPHTSMACLRRSLGTCI